jgi:hypothetical protein
MPRTLLERISARLFGRSRAAQTGRNARTVRPTTLSAPATTRGQRTIAFLEDIVPAPLRRRKALASIGVEVVNDPAMADVIVGQQESHFSEDILALDRLCILWTNEPYFSTEKRPVIEVGRSRIHVFNLYNRNVFADDFWFTTRLEPLPASRGMNVPISHRRIVTLMTRKHYDIVIDGVQRSLTQARAAIALDGRAKGDLDIYGQGWDSGIAVGESRTTNRADSKQDVLAGYNFNLCMENCTWDNYTTEKFWDPIIGRCLPIYYANDTLARYPAVDAAILVNKHPTYDEIMSRIEDITEREFLDRLGTLTAFYNDVVNQGRGRKSRQLSAQFLLDFLQSH